MTFKDWLGVASFIFVMICGWGLTIAGFCVNPLGEVSNSVLWILGQSLIYCSSILGIHEYYKAQLTKFIRNNTKK